MDLLVVFALWMIVLYGTKVHAKAKVDQWAGMIYSVERLMPINCSFAPTLTHDAKQDRLLSKCGTTYVMAEMT